MENLVLVLSILLLAGIILLFGMYIYNMCKEMNMWKKQYLSEKVQSTKNIILNNYNRAKMNIIEAIGIAIGVIGILIALGFAIIPDLF